MSKKIIYLLSLLMALSLVFASCKKNNGLDPNNGGLTPPPDTGAGEEQAGDDGLFNNYDDIPNETEIANTGVYVTTDGNYYRNPVVVARKDGKVFVFAEKRWKSQGSDNDLGIDGDNTTDVIYKVSDNGGYKFNTQEYTVGAKADSPQNSHGAPVVFVKDDKILIAATSGSGLGRTAKTFDQKGKSRIDYITGTINGNSIQWDSWTEIKVVPKKARNNAVDIDSQINGVSAGGAGNKNFNQFGTQPSKGLVTTDGNIYLPVVIAYQGTTSDRYELMGRMTLKSTMDGTTWSVVEEPVGYTDNASVTFGPWKETKLIGGNTDTDLKYLTVPNPWSGSINPGKFGIATDGNKPDAKGTMPASEGSPGFYTITDKWFGETPYTITGTEGNVSISSSGSKMSILVHVQQRASQLYLYRIKDDANLTLEGNGWKLDDVGKSSTVDMLPDGTIVVAAEKGGQDKNYFIRLLRYSQKYIQTKTK